MRVALTLALVWSAIAPAQRVSVVNSVRGLIAKQDLAGAERVARTWQAGHPPSPELAAALSWLARANLEAKHLDQADAFASEAGKMASRFLIGQKLDDDPWLPTAAGSAIEVHAQVLAARGERVEAVDYLKGQLKQFAGTSLPERIRKNINLLDMEGKPAPALDLTGVQGSATTTPRSLAALRGHPVLLFFWAHWCSDCKAEVAILANIQRTFAPQGLVLIGPTRLYGYVAGGEDAPADKEKSYIEEVRRRYYSELNMLAPVHASNFIAYGASTTPTLVLIDRAGVVRYYHPGAVPEAELSARIRALR